MKTRHLVSTMRFGTSTKFGMGLSKPEFIDKEWAMERAQDASRKLIEKHRSSVYLKSFLIDFEFYVADTAEVDEVKLYLTMEKNSMVPT